MKTIAHANYTGSQMALIRRTYAKDCNNDEFDLFMQTCVHRALDPIKKEIYATVVNKKDLDKRQLVIVVGIDGLRSIANKEANYRPDDKEPVYVYDTTLKSDKNPLGLVSASVKVRKQDKNGRWFKVNGVAYWDEFAPLEDVWESGRKTGKFKLKSNWLKMPRLMIAKCAEAQALRKGWSATAGLYIEEEMQSAVMKDITPSDMVNDFEQDKRLEMTRALNSVIFQWEAGGILTPEPVGSLGDKIIQKVESFNNEAQLNAFEGINEHALKQFWAYDKQGALEVKRKIEQKKGTLNA